LKERVYGKEYLVLQVKYEEGMGKMFGTFILIQNLCHEEVYQPHDEKK
jgi:hypothetical protein